jgi:hypothetical protein
MHDFGLSKFDSRFRDDQHCWNGTFSNETSVSASCGGAVDRDYTWWCNKRPNNPCVFNCPNQVGALQVYIYFFPGYLTMQNILVLGEGATQHEQLAARSAVQRLQPDHSLRHKCASCSMAAAAMALAREASVEHLPLNVVLTVALLFIMCRCLNVRASSPGHRYKHGQATNTA